MSSNNALCINEEFQALLSDYTHGAAVLTRHLLQLIIKLSGSVNIVQNDLEQALGLLRKAHPEMVSLRQAIALILKRVEEGTDAGTASQELEHKWNAHLERVTEIAAAYLAQHKRVLTISYSGLVRDAILKATAQGSIIEAYLGEGRPKYEGLTFARELANKGVPCTVFADAAFSSFYNEIDCVLVGADAVGPSSLLNKIGTTAILREARARDIPSAVAYDFLKVVEDGGFPDLIAAYPAEELLAGGLAPQGADGDAGPIRLPNCLRAVNRYFEEVPLHLIDVELTDSQQE